METLHQNKKNIFTRTFGKKEISLDLTFSPENEVDRETDTDKKRIRARRRALICGTFFTILYLLLYPFVFVEGGFMALAGITTPYESPILSLFFYSFVFVHTSFNWSHHLFDLVEIYS